MPYMEESDQYYWDPQKQRSKDHEAFKNDLSDFDPNLRGPKLSDAYRVLKNHIKSPTKTRLQIIVTGKMYSSGNTRLSGNAANVTWGEFEATATSAGLTGQAVQRGGGGFSLEQKIAALFRMTDIPEKITGIYFRILD